MPSIHSKRTGSPIARTEAAARRFSSRKPAESVDPGGRSHREDERGDPDPPQEPPGVLLPQRPQDPQVVRAREPGMDPSLGVDPHQREDDLLELRA